MNNKIVMISQPMSGKTLEEVYEVREKAVKVLTKLGYEVAPTTYTSNYDGIDDSVKHKDLFVLSNAIKAMSKVDCLYMCKGWQNSRGCKLERSIASEYGIRIIYEDEVYSKSKIGKNITLEDLVNLLKGIDPLSPDVYKESIIHSMIRCKIENVDPFNLNSSIKNFIEEMNRIYGKTFDDYYAIAKELAKCSIEDLYNKAYKHPKEK